MVKEELSQRYYQHYRNLITDSGDQPPRGEEEHQPASGTEGPDSGQAEDLSGNQAGGAESLSLEDQVAGLEAVAPIKLAPPASSETAAQIAEKYAPEKPPKRGFCFIATAAYGSPAAPEVVLLQNFRDDHLARHVLGHSFIRAYYRLSPLLAGPIGQNKVCRWLTRLLLAPIIFLLKKSARHPDASSSKISRPN